MSFGEDMCYGDDWDSADGFWDATADTKIHANIMVQNELSETAILELRHSLFTSNSITIPTVPPLPVDWYKGTVPPSAIWSETSNTDIDDADRSDVIPFTAATGAWVEQYSRDFGHKESLTMLNLFAFTPEGGEEQCMEYFTQLEELVEARTKMRVMATGPWDATFATGPAANMIVNAEAGDIDVGEMLTGGEDWELKPREGRDWDSWSLVRYPSVWHFAEMLANDDVRSLQRKAKKGSLLDHAILAVRELRIV